MIVPEPLPIFRDTLTLCAVLLEDLAHGENHAGLRCRLGDTALALFEAVTLAGAQALHRRDHLDDADREIERLRGDNAPAGSCLPRGCAAKPGYGVRRRDRSVVHSSGVVFPGENRARQPRDWQSR